MTSDTSEQGLERLICIALTGDPCEPPKADSVREAHGSYGGVGWSAGSWLDYDRDHCFDLVQLTAFLTATQPEASDSLELSADGPIRRKFLARLQGEISKRGSIDVLRHGVSHGPHDLKLFYGSPSEGNETARAFQPEPLHGDPAVALQPRRDAARVGHRALHQRAAGIHVRTEEQSHETNRGRRGSAVPQGPQSP